MFFKTFRKHVNRISMLIAVTVVFCALLCDVGGDIPPKSMDTVSSAAQIIAMDSPLVRIESTDEVYGTILQAVIVRRLSAQSFRSKVVREFIYTILGLLLAAVTVRLLRRPVHICLHRSQGVIVCYIHNQDGKK